MPLDGATKRGTICMGGVRLGPPGELHATASALHARILRDDRAGRRRARHATFTLGWNRTMHVGFWRAASPRPRAAVGGLRLVWPRAADPRGRHLDRNRARWRRRVVGRA